MKIIRPTPVLGTGSGFTRASTATYYNSAGVLSTAAIDEPRNTFDPITGEYIGLLIEPAATNLLLRSGEFDNAVWVKYGTAQDVGITCTPNVGTALGGGLFADSLVITSSALGTNLRQNTSFGAGTYTWSIHIKQTSGALTTWTMDIADNASSSGALTNEWQRISCTSTVAVASFVDLNLNVSSGSCTFEVWGAQLELGSTATSYIHTTSTTITRAADTISGTGLIYSDVPENDYAAWNAATSYIAPTKVIRTTTHKVYECLNSVTTVNAGLPESTPTRWLEISPTNRWGVFDEQVNTSTVQANKITYLIKPGRINSIALLELNATKVYISMVANNEIIYSAYTNLANGTSVGNWYQYFYEPTYTQNSLIVTKLIDTSLLDLAPYGEGVISVTIEGDSTLSCGVLVLGLSADLGYTQAQPSLGIIDYSKKETDIYGNVSIVKRKYSKRMNASVMFKSTEVDTINNILAQYRATPLIWIGADTTYTSLIIYGFYKDFDITIDNVLYSSCNIQIEGLT